MKGIAVMRNIALLLALFLCGLLSLPVFSQYNNSAWPAFRGAESNGSTNETVMNSDQAHLKILWSVLIPGSGHSSPIVKDGTVYLSTSYSTPKRQLIFVAAHWIAALAILVLTFMAFLRLPAVPTMQGHAFTIGLHIGLLFILTAIGTDILGCKNDSFRMFIVHVLIITVALDTSRVLTSEWRSLQLGLAVTGIFSIFVFVCYIVNLQSLRQPELMLIICLQPLFTTAMCIQRIWGRQDNIPLWQKLAPLAMLTALLISLGNITVKAETVAAAFWSIQPTSSLHWPPVYIGLSVAVLLVGFVLYWMGRSIPPFRVTGHIILAWACLLTMPILLTPLINSWHYLKYQFVRGSLQSPLGMTGLITAAGFMVLASFALFVTKRWAKNEINSQVSRLALCILPIVGGFLPVLGDRIGSAGGTIGAIVAVNADTGQIRWVADGLTGSSTGPISGFNSPATPSPVIIDKLVVAYFGELGAFACNKHSGVVNWSYLDLPYFSNYGVASSLAGIQSAVVIQSDSDRTHSTSIPSYITALSIDNGRPIWRHLRNVEEAPSWRTPTVFQWKGRQIVCSWGVRSCDFLAADTGKLLRRVRGIDCGDGDPVSSPVVSDSEIFFTGPDRLIGVSLPKLFESSDSELLLDNGSDGFSTEDRKLSKIKPSFNVELDGDGSTCGTPVFNGQQIFGASDSGTIWRLTRQEEKVTWKSEISSIKSSPVVANQHLYAVAENGTVHSFYLSSSNPTPAKTLELREEVIASPAVAGSSLFIRTQSHLFCLRGSK